MMETKLALSPEALYYLQWRMPFKSKFSPGISWSIPHQAIPYARHSPEIWLSSFLLCQRTETQAHWGFGPSLAKPEKLWSLLVWASPCTRDQPFGKIRSLPRWCAFGSPYKSFHFFCRLCPAWLVNQLEKLSAANLPGSTMLSATRMMLWFTRQLVPWELLKSNCIFFCMVLWPLWSKLGKSSNGCHRCILPFAPRLTKI